MPVKEILAKAIGFGLVSAACIAGGGLAFYGSHAYNDYFNFWLGVLLVLIGLGVGGLGVAIIGLIVRDARARRREAALHITPRPGPLAPPPPWGMRDIGRPGVVRVGGEEERPGGGGSVRVMSVAVSNIDAPLLIVGLMVWTVAFLIWLAPR